MDSSPSGLSIHSLAEAHLYLMVTPCPACGGPLQPDEAGSRHDDEARRLMLPAICRRCRQPTEFRFDTSDIDPDALVLNLPEPGRPLDPHAIPPINPTDEPSRIIDVAGWLSLYDLMVTTARRRARQIRSIEDRATVRQLRIQARRCLQEALKFYDEDDELPPPEAFFHPASRRRFREHPEQFARDRIINLRAKLPLPRPVETGENQEDEGEPESSSDPPGNEGRKRRWRWPWDRRP